MKVILHGATDCGSSNYGDFLYGKIIYDFLLGQIGLKSDDIFFYNPSEYYEKYIDSNRKTNLCGNIKDADVGIYIPGGYFGEGHNASWKETLVQMKRFIPFGLKCMFHRKPFAVIGVGAGPNNNVLFRAFIKSVVQHASVVTVRDKESYEALAKMGCNNIDCCSDAIIAYNMYEYDLDGRDCTRIKENLNEKSMKGLLVHFNHSKEAAVKFGEAVRLFTRKNKDYLPVVSSDQLLAGEDEIVAVFEQAYGSKNYIRYEYDNPYEFGELITSMSFVLTSKLHVGVTAVTKGKPTLAVAVHPEKTERFYKQIAASRNFLNLEQVGTEQIVNKMDELKELRVEIPDEAIRYAKENMKKLELFLHNNRKKNFYEE